VVVERRWIRAPPGRLTRVNAGIDEKLTVDTVFAALAMDHPSKPAPESNSLTVAIVLGGL
jgi:hypothetical protein